MPYNNGIETKSYILNVCEKLFLEKGFRNTSISDICKAAHVNRNTINYHFGNKELIRNDVLMEQYNRNYLFTERYCRNESIRRLLVIYMIWCQLCSSRDLRDFYSDYITDHPTYNSKSVIAKQYNVTYQMGFKLDAKNVYAPFAYSTVYGYITTLILLVCQHHERYNGRDVFTKGSIACLRAWGIEKDAYIKQWSTLEKYMDKIPIKEIEDLI